MALSEYRIREFLGIDQSAEQCNIDAGASPDACNMDTTDGNLAVAKGYVRHKEAAVPGEGPIRHLFAWPGLNGNRLIAIAGNAIYVLREEAEAPEWTLLYTYPDTVNGLRFCVCEAQIDSVDVLLFACGEHGIIKWDGVSDAAAFGTSTKLSDVHVNYLAMHYGRLFAAGNPAFPSRLYWSQAPGDGRNIEDWRKADASENVSGGHLDVGDTASDPITGLFALSNQLLICKRRSIYRLLGDRPGNFRVHRVYAEVERMAHSSVVLYGDVPFWMTGAGLFYFDGQTALRSKSAHRLRHFLHGADFSNCRAVKHKEKLYFTAYELHNDPDQKGAARDMDNAMIVYDIARQTYMLRRGFSVGAICAHEGSLLMVNDKRIVYRLEEGRDYDGAPIEAYWQTPLTDLHNKPVIKSMQEIYLRGKSEGGEGEILLLEVTIGNNTRHLRHMMPRTQSDVLEIPLKNEGRTFALRFSNEAGSRFCITGGVQLLFEQRLRTT